MTSISGRTTGGALAMSFALVLTASGPRTVLSDDDPPPTRGEVRRIDADGGVLTLRHERIEHLDMPAMTMDFRIADPRLLTGIGEGAAVEFRARDENGAMVIHELRVVDPDGTGSPGDDS